MFLGRWLTATVLLTTAATGAAAAEGWPGGANAKLDAYFDALQTAQQANGSIAISQKGVLRYQRSVGFARLENGQPEPANDGTRYRIGSASRLFTAVLVMQLVEQASITLDSKLAEFYPDLPNALEITYRDLLQHRSGLANYTDAPGFQSWRTTQKTHAELLKIIADGGAKFAPREHFEYSGSDYLLLGYMLEKVYERSYDDIMRRHITDKLGLARTYYAGTGNANLESIAYQRTPGGWVAVIGTDPSIDGGAGGMLSAPTDLVRVMDALFTGKLVSAQSLESMRNQDGGSGMGLWPYEIAGQKGLGVTGDGEGFHTRLYYFPERNLSIAYTSNAVALPVDEIVKETLLTIFERGHRPSTPPAH
jgi:CubicO group peptidase (beta-lactamase class C family)